MSLVVQILVATALIAGLIILRLFSDRHAQRTKLRDVLNNTDCDQTGCLHSCESDRAEQTLKRSSHHAH